MLLSIIIVSYNVRHYLRQCLDSVWRSAETAGVEVEVFVVDNRSADGSIEHIATAFPDKLSGNTPKARLHLIANQRNVGFGRANNQAVRQSKGDYILFLNPDTILSERTLKDCLEADQKEERLGAMGVQMLRTDGRFAFESRRGLPTPWTAFCKMSGLATLFPRSRWFGKYYMRYLDENTVTPIEIVSGAFMLCSRQAIEECGAFDETFFMYGEDIDLSYRFLQKGYRNIYVPTPILHYKGESTQKNTYRYVHVFYQAMLIFFRKHFPTSSCILAVPVYLAIFLQAIFTLMRQRLNSLGRFLAPNRYRRPITIQYVGPKESHTNIKAHQDAWGINLHCSTEVPTHSNADIVAFSAEHYSYEQILNLFKQSDHRSHLGTYFPSTGTLILGSEVYS